MDSISWYTVYARPSFRGHPTPRIYPTAARCGPYHPLALRTHTFPRRRASQRTADEVSYERRGPVAVVTIDRPERRNAVDRATAEGLLDAWTRFEEGDAAVGVLTGAEGTFSAGADLEAMDLGDSPEGWLGFTRERVSKPTVAAVEGHCVAGGL